MSMQLLITKIISFNNSNRNRNSSTNNHNWEGLGKTVEVNKHVSLENSMILEILKSVNHK